MAENQVEIDVILNADQAEKGFEKLEEGSKAVGESFGSVGKAVSSLGGEANQALGTVGESLGGVVDGFGELATAAKTGQMSFTALAGPVGIAVMAVMELINAFREYGNEVDGTNIKIEAYAASATELTSIIEQLSDAQVELNKETIKAFRIQSQRAQGLINEGELINQNTAEIKGQILEFDKQIKQAQKNLKIAKGNIQVETALRRNLNSIISNRATLVDKLSKLESKADALSVKGAKERAKLTDMVDEKLKESPEFKKKIAEQESKLLTQARVDELQATKDQIKSQIEIARLGSKQKIKDIQAIEDIGADVRNKAIKGEEKRLQAEITSIEKAAAEKRKAQNEKIRQKALVNRARERAMEIARDRQLQSELKQLRTLEIEEMRIGGASAQKIAQQRYNDELKAAGDNQNKQLIALRRFENQKTRIEQQAQSQRQAMETAQAEQRQAFIESTVLFDTQRIEDQTTRELALLDLRYKKEIELNAHTQEQITELQRRQALERQDILDQSLSQSFEKMRGMTEDLTRATTGAIYQSLVDAGQFDLQFEELKHDFDEKVGQARQEMIKAQSANDVNLARQKEEEITNITQEFESQRKKIREQESQALPLMFGQILKGLGQEAAVEAMMETARGIATFFTAPALSGNHFAAAGVFAGAAALAGTAGASITNQANSSISKAGRGGGGGAMSPTGTPQTAPTPQREEAETSQMVFNINFGGAVIYDTQRAAEQALADRITTLQNTRRRGAPRRSF